MANQRIKIVLRWIRVLDILEPAWDDSGEFVFTSKVRTEPDGDVFQTRMPSEGHYAVTRAIRDRTLDNLNKTLFEGEVTDYLKLELIGEELDQLTANDFLDHYERVWEGSANDWIGRYWPGDEGSTDPENMSNWRICFDVTAAD